MPGFDARGLASRVAGLIHAQFGGDLRVAARALDVDADEIYRIVAEETAYPNIDLLAKIVNRFGVDASWLITGEYDWRTHMGVLADAEEGRTDNGLLLRLVGREETGRRVMQLAERPPDDATGEGPGSRESA
jgi:hypothetical protein